MQAEGIPKMDVLRHCDPYVILFISDQVHLPARHVTNLAPHEAPKLIA